MARNKPFLTPELSLRPSVEIVCACEGVEEQMRVLYRSTGKTCFRAGDAEVLLDLAA